MAYVPNPDDATRPIGSDPPSTLTAELRGIKDKMNTLDSNKQGKVVPKVVTYPSGEEDFVTVGAQVIDVANGTFHRYRASANTTFSFTHPTLAANETVFVIVRLTNGGNFDVQFSNVHWDLGLVPDFTENGTDVLVFYKPTPESTFWEGKRTMRDVKESA